jgi:IclR family pca regulon transcriptional regulator
VVLDGAEVVIVARSVSMGGSTRVLAYGLHLGARLPAHATSTGRMLLATLPRAELGAWLKGRSLPRLTLQTTTDVKRLRVLIDQAARDDYCLASEEHELGVHALAVPLRNMQGKTVAALNVVAPQARLRPEVIQGDLLPLLLEAARELRSLV